MRWLHVLMSLQHTTLLSQCSGVHKAEGMACSTSRSSAAEVTGSVLSEALRPAHAG